MMRSMDEATRAPQKDRPRPLSWPWLQFLLAFCVFTVVLVVVRGDMLWTNAMMNPDEAELLAEGRTAALDLFPYSGYTSSTHLFLWPFALGVLDLLGVPLTLTTAHVLGGLSYVMVSTTGWFLMMRRIGGVRAALLVLPAAATLLIGYDPDGYSDFLSMTSESLPMVILSIAALVMLGPTRPMTSRQLAAGSMVAGLAVWAKPQSGPLAVALVAACVLMSYVETNRSDRSVRAVAAFGSIVRSGAMALLAFVTPTAVFLGAMTLGGTIDDLLREPMAAMWSYTAQRDASQGVASPSFTDRLGEVWHFVSSYAFAGAGALGAVLYAPLLVRTRSWLLGILGLTAILLPVVAALVSLLPLHPLFPHYANLPYLGCLLATCVAVRLAGPAAADAWQGVWVEVVRVGTAVAVVGALVITVVSPRFAEMRENARRAVSGEALWYHQQVPRDATPLSAECPAGSVVEVWGWASELYAYYDWVPASRYVNASWLLSPGAKQHRYVEILRQELQDNPPACIVEALGPAFFAAVDTTQTLSRVVPGASSLLTSCYRSSEATTFDGRAVTLFRRTANCAGG